MKQYNSPIISFLCLLLISACSVKEQRGGCPVYVNINFDKVIESGSYTNSFVNVGAVGEVFSEDVDIRQYEAVGLDVPAPRGIIYMSAAFGHESFSCNGDSLVVKEGAEISPLFLWADKVLCHDDLYYAEADPRKQYCKMNIVVVGLNPGEDFEYALRLKADCNAISLYGADALEGNYTVIAKNKNASGYEVLVPRQRENNIVLELLEDEVSVSLVDVGKELEANGYDWNKTDLDDVIVVVDFSRMRASVEIIEWNQSKIEITI